MKRRKKGLLKRILVGLCSFVVVFALAFFGIQFFTKTGIFRIPGVVYYDESLNEDELSLLKTIFTDEVDLDKDVTISASESPSRPKLSKGEFLVEILVPVTDFYETRTDVGEFDEGEVEYVSVNDLDFTKKLLTINDEYYLDNFNAGAEFRIIKFESEKYDEEISDLVEEAFAREWPEKDTVLSFAQTGVTALSRGMHAKLQSVGDATYFAENIKDYLSSFDLTHTSNESSFSSLAHTRNICSDARFIDTLVAIGLDIVELTGNHNQDCGDAAARETIDIYKDKGVRIVGGGKTADEAAAPLEINEKGSGITFLAYNQSTGGATHDNTPGANQYYENNATAEISAAKERGEFVIVDVQYYECSNYDHTVENTACDFANSSAGDQIGFFRHLIDLGADIVVGTSAHQPQTFELYGNGAIYYGLGNLFFDQIWWPGTTRSLILEHYFYNGKLLQTKIQPTVYGNDMKTDLMDAETTKWFLERLIKVRP